MKPEYKKKSIRSYVIRAGRITEGQKNAFDQWWPIYGLSLFDGPQSFAEVFGNCNPLVVEVGFGMGDSLIDMAQAEPDKNFVGIEVHPPGVGRLINQAGVLGIKNLRVYMADAKDVLQDCFADESITRFQLYFPDPWHKKKHNKRRIVQPDFVALVAGKLHKDGLFHLATDWAHYAEHMMELMCLAPQLENIFPDYLFASKPDFRPETKFERRGERLGHKVWDLLFKKR